MFRKHLRCGVSTNALDREDWWFYRTVRWVYGGPGRQRPGFVGTISTEQVSPRSWCVLPEGYRYTVPPALLCPYAEVRKECKTHRERRRKNDCSHNKGLRKALVPELSMLSSPNYWLRSPGKRDWSFLQETVFGCGLEAHSLLPTTSPSHLASFPHAFLEEAGMHLKPRVLWKQPEGLPSTLGARTPTKHRHREGGRWQAEFSTDHA